MEFQTDVFCKFADFLLSTYILSGKEESSMIFIKINMKHQNISF